MNFAVHSAGDVDKSIRATHVLSIGTKFAVGQNCRAEPHDRRSAEIAAVGEQASSAPRL